MQTSSSDSTGRSTHPRFIVAGVVIVLATLYALLQRSSLAPFPHTADDFMGGLAIGLLIGSAIAWFGGRR